MTHNFRFLVTLAVTGVVALGCSGRSTGGTDTNALPDGVVSDEGDVRVDGGRDVGRTDTVVQTDDQNPVDYIGPVANAIAPIQQSDDSVKCPPDGTTETPAFVNGATGLTLDVVVVSPRYVVSKDKTSGEVTKYGYFVADAGLTQSEAWRGIAITVPVTLTSDEWQVGDALTLTADHTEYYCFSQIAVTAATLKGTLPIPTPVDIEPADLGSQDKASAEQYEGVLVRVRNVTVVTTPALGTDGKDHGSFLADDGLIVANDFKVPYMATGTDARKVGDKFDSIVGVVKYSFDQYILVPRTGDDMVLEGTQPGDESPVEQSDDVATPQDVIEAVDAPVDADVPADVAGDTVLPTGTTLQSLQSHASSTGCTGNAIATIQPALTMAPVVVVSPKFVASKDKLDGYYVSDAGLSTAEPFTGALMNVDVALATNFQPGDVLTLTADWVEFYCLTEIKATAAAKSGTAAVPAPRVIAAADLATQNAATAEPLEGVLVELQNVAVTDANPDAAASKDYGSFAVANGVIIANTFKLNYMSEATDQRKVGDTFSKIVGVVSYSFGKYVVLPRSNEDMVLGPFVTPETTPEFAEPSPEIIEPSPEVVEVTDPGTEVIASGVKVVDLQGGAGSDSCTTGEVNGTPQYGITMAPVVVTSAQYSATSSFHGYYVADVNGGATDSGMILMVAKALNTAFVPGDKLDITGDYKEYYCMTEVVVASTATPPATVGTVTKTGTATVPAPTVLAASVLQNGGGAAAEAYEGQIVTIQNVAVTNLASSDGKGWFQVGTGIEVVKDFFYPTSPYEPALNQNLTSITGGLKFHHGKYRIAPRTAADFVTAP